MLVLTRMPSETIIIGDSVKVTIVSIHGRTVKVGISAPKEISVHREEVYNKIIAESDNDDEAYNERFNSRFDDFYNGKGEV